MKRKQTNNRWLLAMITAALAMLTVSCTVDDGEDTELPVMADTPKYELAVYEGEWTVNRQVVDTARLTVQSTMRVRLPEAYLLSLMQPSDVLASVAVPQGKVAEVGFYAYGYSEYSEYLYFASPTEPVDVDEPGGGLRFIACSFDAIVDGATCRVDLLCRDNACAVMQRDTGQWTLLIPLSAFRVTNRATGQSTVHELPVAVSLYYNTKRRIA